MNMILDFTLHRTMPHRHCSVAVLLFLCVNIIPCLAGTSKLGVATTSWTGGCKDLEVKIPKPACAQTKINKRFSQQALDQVTWYVNYGRSPTFNVSNLVCVWPFANLGRSVEFVPMIWGQGEAESFNASQIPAGTTHLLAFNAPNFASESNLNPEVPFSRAY